MWHDMATAPKDGTVILTDQGSARWFDDAYFHGVNAGWYLCFVDGTIPADDLNRELMSALTPIIWMPYPDLPATKA